MTILMKTGLKVRAMFAQYYFTLLVLHNILHHFTWGLYHFNCVPILEWYIIPIKNHDIIKYISISALEKAVGSCDAKMKVKH